MKFLKILAIIFIVFILFYAGTGYYNDLQDRAKVNNIKAMAAWVENQYTLNGKYPTSQEFYNKFPDFGDGSATEGYAGYDQDFYLSYRLGFFGGARKRYALGSEEQYGLSTGFGGWYYKIHPCSRWDQSGLRKPQTSIYIQPPTSGGVIVDFEKGTIYFKDNHSDAKVLLLSDLVKPRIFDKGNDKIVVTNGGNIYSYDFYHDGFDPRDFKLLHPQKIGEVPTSCPASYLDTVTNKWQLMQ